MDIMMDANSPAQTDDASSKGADTAMDDHQSELKNLKSLGQTVSGCISTRNPVPCTWAFTWSEKTTLFFVSESEAFEFKAALSRIHINRDGTEKQKLYAGIGIGVVMTIAFLNMFGVCFSDMASY